MIRRGDLVIFISFVPDGDGYEANGMDSKQPCLFIGRAKRGVVSSRENRAWGIPLSDAWRYVTPNGDPSEYLFRVTANIGNHLGLGDGIHARRQIWTAIMAYLPDLIRTKEFEMVRGERHGPGKAYGELELLVEGERVGGVEMRR